TLTLLPYGAIIAHVGDSRVYRVRNRKLEQLTFDHSLVWEMRASGTVPAGVAGASLIPKNVITRSLGPYPDVNVDLEGPFPIQAGDIFMLCSDGLTGEVEDDEIASLLSHLDPERAARVLVDLANLRGGPDNITVSIAKVANKTLETTETVTSPLTIGGSAKHSSPGPVAYSLLAASLLGCALSAVLESFPFAMLLGAVAVAFAVYVAVKLSGVSSGKKIVGQNARFGKGPYTRTESVSGAKLLVRLEEIGAKLRKVAREEDMAVDLAVFDKYFSKAQAAAKASDEAAAVNFFCFGLSNYMDQLRG
ncbi:MAG: hypothetical protein VX438_08230, partial [Planctomycetota bacterium]|nr:hypothetical protein [Planctomycetota bacterium]